MKTKRGEPPFKVGDVVMAGESVRHLGTTHDFLVGGLYTVRKVFYTNGQWWIHRENDPIGWGTSNGWQANQFTLVESKKEPLKVSEAIEQIRKLQDALPS